MMAAPPDRRRCRAAGSVVLQVMGHDESEITGPVFDPTGTRLYFSSQRGESGQSEDGVTFEISGPFSG
jgi:hypothetical protein